MFISFASAFSGLIYTQIISSFKLLFLALKNNSFNMAVKMPWEKLREIYEYEPSNMKELLFVKGIGKSAIRALSYITEVIMGTRPSMEDPVRYSFAVGGKAGRTCLRNPLTSS